MTSNQSTQDDNTNVNTVDIEPVTRPVIEIVNTRDIEQDNTPDNNPDNPPSAEPPPPEVYVYTAREGFTYLLCLGLGGPRGFLASEVDAAQVSFNRFGRVSAQSDVFE